MLRGGSWNNNIQNARSANRNNNTPDNRNNNNGFRVVSAAAAVSTPPVAGSPATEARTGRFTDRPGAPWCSPPRIPRRIAIRQSGPMTQNDRAGW